MPAALTANQYRYLSFRMYINGDYQEPADGMIGRWIWSTGACTRVSRDIPYDVGWHTYTVDLYDPYNGTPVEVTSGCSFTPWSQTGQVVLVRFDPNENYTGIYVPPLVFHQEFDWILLTKVDRVAQKAVFPIQLSLNKNLQDLHSIALFYTDNVSNPGQHLINVYNPSRVSSNEAFLPDMRQPGAEDSRSGSPDVLASDSFVNKIFLPMVSYNNINLESNQYYYSWDTTTVPPGEYYICAQADDGYNVTMFCSHAPMQVYVP
jgi:hypothetical protein